VPTKGNSFLPPGTGKGAKTQHLGSPHSGMRSTITKGDPLSRMAGQYGKGHSFLAGPQGAGATMPVSGSSGLANIRGGQGGMKRVPRSGGLGPGAMGTPGTADPGYSVTANPDQE
jgi:hypothetical protein